MWLSDDAGRDGWLEKKGEPMKEELPAWHQSVSRNRTCSQSRIGHTLRHLIFINCPCDLSLLVDDLVYYTMDFASTSTSSTLFRSVVLQKVRLPSHVLQINVTHMKHQVRMQYHKALHSLQKSCCGRRSYLCPGRLIGLSHLDP